MEKVLYPLWKPAGQDAEAFRDHLLGDVATSLLASGAHALRVSVADDAVAPAVGLRQEKLGPPIDAMLSLWVDSANDCTAWSAIIEPACERFAAYLVTESVPLPHEAPPGERMPGWTQVVFLERPAGMSESDWLAVWLGSHTAIAIETQSTFAYRQNVVVRALTPDAPVVHAIVEESFPEAAMASPQAFYDADSDEAMQANVTAMIESVSRFIDFERISVVPTSEYRVK